MGAGDGGARVDLVPVRVHHPFQALLRIKHSLLGPVPPRSILGVFLIFEGFLVPFLDGETPWCTNRKS